MLTVNKTFSRELLINNNNTEIKTIFLNNKIWLNKKEISKLFGIEKIEIKKILRLIKDESSFNKNQNIFKKYNKIKKKNESFYSLEYIISIGYRLRLYNETKFIINSNKILNEHNIKRGMNNKRIINNSNFLNKIFNYFNKEFEYNY